MNKLKKIVVLGILGVSLLVSGTTTYACEGTKADIHNADNSMEVRATMPACPKCKSNKWVIPHGLVSYACLNCNYYFM